MERVVCLRPVELQVETSETGEIVANIEIAYLVDDDFGGFRKIFQVRIDPESLRIASTNALHWPDCRHGISVAAMDEVDANVRFGFTTEYISMLERTKTEPFLGRRRRLRTLREEADVVARECYRVLYCSCDEVDHVYSDDEFEAYETEGEVHYARNLLYKRDRLAHGTVEGRFRMTVTLGTNVFSDVSLTSEGVVHVVQIPQDRIEDVYRNAELPHKSVRQANLASG